MTKTQQTRPSLSAVHQTALANGSAMARSSVARRDLAALILAATCWGVGTVISKAALAEVPPLTLLPIQLAASLAILADPHAPSGDLVSDRWLTAARSARSPEPGSGLRPEPARAHHDHRSLSVLLWALEPLMILFLAAWFLRERITPAFIVLSMIAVAGMVLIVYDPSSSSGQLIGVALTIAGIACCAVYSVVTRRWIPDAKETSQVILAQQGHALVLALGLVIVAGLAGGQIVPTALTPIGLASAVGSGALYYAGAYWFYLGALRHVPASFAAVSFYLIPIVGVAAGAVLLGERLDLRQWIGAAIVLAAVLAIIRQPIADSLRQELPRRCVARRAPRSFDHARFPPRRVPPSMVRRTQRPRNEDPLVTQRVCSCSDVEATTGFEPVNRGFADLRVEPLHHVARCGSRTVRPMDAGCPSRIRTSVHGSKVRCPTTRRRGSGPRKEEWSGRRDSNPRPSPWQGDALPTEPLPLERSVHPMGGAESQDRTGDTAIFSRVLYQLSYLGPMANQPSAARRRVERYHGPPEASNRGGRPPSAPLPYSRPASAAASDASSGGSPVSSRSRLIRSRIAGWVDIRPDERSSNFLIGLVKYRCCVARLATSRTSWSAPILASARSSPYGLRVSSTAEASARYSRWRLTASWMKRLMIGARMARTMATTKITAWMPPPLPPLSRERRPPRRRSRT